MKKWSSLLRKGLYKCFALLMATLGKRATNLLLLTCRWEIEGLDLFKKVGKEEKCILMLWHNRLTIAPFILSNYAGQFNYAPLVSKSRDGELISAIIDSYPMAKAIRVSHQARHEAFQEMVDRLEKKREIVIITPDGPRGPVYQMKPGIAAAAIQTAAWVIPLDWRASDFVELRTWDKLRFPKPFSTVHVTFGPPVHLPPHTKVEEALSLLQEALKS